MSLLQVVMFTFSLWFGLYLLGRNPQKAVVRYAGLGLLAYALALALDLLASYTADEMLQRWRLIAALLPSAFWFGASLHLLSEVPPIGHYLPWGAVAYVMLAGLLDVSPVLVATVPVVGLASALWLVWRAFREPLPARPLGLLLVATLFFGLGTGLILFPLDWLPREWLLLAIGLDLVALGGAVAVLDAFDEGEALLPDYLRSLGASGVMALVFGGQVALIMAIEGGASLPMVALLLGVITAAIVVQTFSDPIQAALDRLIFARFPRLRRARADLRAVASALPRVREPLDWETLDEVEFTRLTRRALSHFGNLQRLAASPLTCLPIIDARLAERGVQDSTLERAAELKLLLAESIARLKPRDGNEFGTSDEWRYYNALYFPYVMGLRPYSRRVQHDALDPITREALAWFQAQVPERTLHNWQNTAAQLVARDLQETMAQRGRVPTASPGRAGSGVN